MHQQIEPQIKFTSNSGKQTQDSQPWMSEQTRNIENPIVRMHNQMIEFYNFVAPSNQQHEAKSIIATQFQMQLLKLVPKASVMCPFLKNRLYMKGTQLEIYVVVPLEANWQQNCQQIIQKIAQVAGLKLYNLSVENNDNQVRVIGEHIKTSIQIWIRFVPESWKLFISQIDICVASSCELKYLYIVIYCMLRQRSLHFWVRSLLIYGLCSFFIYERRRQRVRTLTENIIKFLEFFSIGFTQQDKQRKIMYKQGNIYSYTMNGDKTFIFQIADKVDLSTRKVKQFFKVIHNRYKVLGNYYYLPQTSVLKHLINPCSGKFFY